MTSRTQRKHTDLIEALPDSIYRISADFRVLEFFPGGVKPELPSDELIGRTLDDVLPRELASAHKAAIIEAFSNGTVVKRSLTIPIDGIIKSREYRYVPLTEDEIMVIVRESSDLGPDETTPNFIDAIPDMVFRISADFRYLDFIPGKETDPFVPPEVFLGRTIDEIMPADLASQHMVAVTEALTTGKIITTRYTLPIDGEPCWYECKIVPSEGKEVLAFVRDCTDDRPTGIQSAARALPESIYRISADFRFLEFFPGAGDQPPGSPEQFLGRTFDEVMTKELAVLNKAAITEAFATGRITRRFLRFAIGGKMRTRECRYVPLESHETMVIVREITDEAEERNAAEVVDAIPDMVFRIDSDFRYLQFIPGRGVRPFVPPESFLGRTVAEVMPRDIAMQCTAAIKQALTKSEIVTFIYKVQMDGESFWHESKIVPCGGNEVLAFVRDCTEDHALGRINVVSALPDPIFRVNADLRIIEYHPGGGKVEPWIPPEKFLGRSIDDVMPCELVDTHKSGAAEALRTGHIARRTYTVSIKGKPHLRECRYVPTENNEIIAIIRDFTNEQLESGDSNAIHRDPGGPTVDPYGLSQREVAVLQFLVEGAADKDIAAKLGVSVFTVNKHVGNILLKMGAESRTEAAVRALREHICD